MKTRWAQCRHWITAGKRWFAPAGLAPLSPVEAMLPMDIRRVIDCP